MHSSSKLPKLLSQISSYQSSNGAKRLLYSLSQRRSEEKNGLTVGKTSDIKTAESKAVSRTFLGSKAADGNSYTKILDSEHNKVKGLTNVDKSAKLPDIEPGVKSLLDKIMDLSPNQLKSLNDHLQVVVEKEAEAIKKELEATEKKSSVALSKVEASTKVVSEKNNSKDVSGKEKNTAESTTALKKGTCSGVRATEVNFKLSHSRPSDKANKTEKSTKHFDTGSLAQSNAKKIDSRLLSKKASSVTKNMEKGAKYTMSKTSVKADTTRIKSSLSYHNALQVKNKQEKNYKVH